MVSQYEPSYSHIVTMFKLDGDWHLLDDPIAEQAAYRMNIGAVLNNSGFVSLYVVHCSFSIPYFMCRLMWLLRDKRVGSKSD
jgi:hypothetical protein